MFYFARTFQNGRFGLLTQLQNWRERAFIAAHPGLVIRVLHPLELLYNKLETDREKDFDGVLQILNSRLFSRNKSASLLKMQISPKQRNRALSRIWKRSY